MSTRTSHGGKRFNPIKVYVSFFDHILPQTNKNMSETNRLNDFKKHYLESTSIPLLEFIEMGKTYRSKIENVRSFEDPTLKAHSLARDIPAAVISCRVRTRDFTKSIDENIRGYNGIVMYEIPKQRNKQKIFEALKQKPWVWYISESADGRYIDVIVPLDNGNYEDHWIYCDTLEKELRKAGLLVNEDCGGLYHMMHVTYDEDAWMNEDCVLYELPKRQTRKRLEE
ncbi:MAG: hypothetical protein KBS58_03825 [Bacteroidales bacterium]|nr:hypothetical protein [Candidatus Cacconaster equi]